MKYQITLIFSFCVLQTFAQVAIDSTKYIDSENTGTVKEITNKEVCAIVIFVSGPESNWRIQNKKRVLKRDANSFEQLTKELNKFNIDFKVHLEAFNLEEDFKVDSAVNYKKPVINAAEMSSRYNRKNVEKIWDYYENSESSFFKDKEYLSFEGGYFLIIHHEGLGDTRATPAFTNRLKTDNGLDGLPEYLTIFEFDENMRKHNKHTISHEALHLFGAWDLYSWQPYGYKKEDYDKIVLKYPKSIMRNSNQITIDPITAWRIGINNNPESWFLEKIPEIYHKNHHR